MRAVKQGLLERATVFGALKNFLELLILSVDCRAYQFSMFHLDYSNTIDAYLGSKFIISCMFEKKNTIVAIMGPTASGKTDLALRMAEQAPVEIISVDSALVYRGMDIGTAKPSAQMMARVPHHLIDIRAPEQSYSAAEFREEALTLIESILARGHLPVLVGGTMLYYRSLFNGLSNLPSANPEVRAALDARARAEGWQAMHAYLAEIDPVAAARINPNDPQRIQRAIEVYEISGQTMTELCAAQQVEPFAYPCLKVVVAPGDRANLHARIEQRFRQMLEQGFVSEVEQLRSRKGLHLALPSMRSVGYRQIWEYLDQQYDYEEMIARGVAATRQLAKRQFTWLRKEPNAVWFDSDKPALFDRVMAYFMSQEYKL